MPPTPPARPTRATLAGWAAAFATLFDGLPRAHGRYVVPATAVADARGKLTGKPWTSHQPATDEDWILHLSGEHVTVPDGDGHVTGPLGLGVVPIRDDATCVFGAIDVDVYPLDLDRLLGDCTGMELPVVVCRTKSGGAHVYLFLSEPAPARLVRDRLTEWAVLLGHPGVEVFPKQTRLASERDEGSWINVPYAGGDRSLRYAMGRGGEALSVDGFVGFATSRRVSVSYLESFKPVVPEVDVALEGLPPCLQVLTQRGFGEGQRNNGLFNMGVYAKKRWGDDYAGHVDDFNVKFMDPPLGSRDVQGIVKSLAKKSYNYRCNDQPIQALCNRQACLGCAHGVGGPGDDPGLVLGELVKLRTDPPAWLWDVAGARIELTTPQLLDQRAFHARCVEELNVWPAMVRPVAWQKLVRERLSRVTSVDVPSDATREGQMWEHLTRFCTGRVVARTKDEMLLGKPWDDPDTGRTYFRAVDFFNYLSQRRFGGVTERDVFKWLRKKGVEHHFDVIKGAGTNFWSVPSLRGQDEPHDVPRAPAPEAM